MRSICSMVSVLVMLGISAQGASAELEYPLSIAVAESGDAFLADRNLPGVWKLQGNTLSLLFQGSKTFRTPLNAIRCVAIDRNGKLLAGDSSTREVYRFNDEGQPIGLTRKATVADASSPAKDDRPKLEIAFGQIGIPMDIAVAGSGELFVSDLELHRIVKVAERGGDPIEFVAIPAPRGLCFDDTGNLWVVSGRQLVKVSSGGEKTTVVAEGVFEFPHTVALAADGTAFVCDGYAKAIWRIPAGGKPEKWVTGAPLINPVGMRLKQDKLFVVDPRAQCVFHITLDGQVSTITLKPGGN